jgi:hypothetical protein
MPEETQKTRKRYDVSPEEFVEASWQESSTPNAVARRLGMPRSCVLSRACTYRKRGVRLKRMRPPSRKLNIERLNKLAAAVCNDPLAATSP